MKHSSERILTTHVGSLPRPAALLQAAGQQGGDELAHQKELARAVNDVVRQQREHGIDVIDDGEFGKPDFAGLNGIVWKPSCGGIPALCWRPGAVSSRNQARLSGCFRVASPYEYELRQKSTCNE